MNFKQEIAQALAEAISAQTGKSIKIEEIAESIETPPQNMGDLAFPCFKLAKLMKTSPQRIAENIAASITPPPFIEKVITAGPYLNFAYRPAVFVESVLKAVKRQGEGYGRSYIGQGQNIVIDYSSPNIAKPFHVGHFRATIIGNALCRILSFIGYNTIGINHLGDWGTQFGKLIVAYTKWGDAAKVEAEGISELQRLYVMYHETAAQDTTLDCEARAWMLKMQEGDEEALGIWRWFVDVSMAEFSRIYEMLGVHFDHITGESFYNDKMEAAVQELRHKCLLQESDGAMIINLDSHKLPPCLILRSDGGTLYHTRDICAALYRQKTFNFAKALYVTAMDQSLHFAQLFSVLEEMGYEWAQNMAHVPFGLVSLESGKLSSRKGHVVLMEELLNEAVARTQSIIEEKNPNLENKEHVARQVGIGALVFGDLYNSRIKDTTFSWERVLSFEGESGPYVQYTHARACSVLAKAGEQCQPAYSLLGDSESLELAKAIHAFGERVQEAAAKHEPYILARNLVDIAQAFNKFYHEHPILSEAPTLRAARLQLVEATRQVIYTGLRMLGIEAPEKM